MGVKCPLFFQPELSAHKSHENQEHPDGNLHQGIPGVMELSVHYDIVNEKKFGR